MNADCTTSIPTGRSIKTIMMVTLLWLACVTISFAQTSGEQFECFTEPYRTVRLAAPEMGVIAEIPVVEGQSVSQSQVVARLDDSVLKKSLEVARAATEATGALDAALSELDTNQQQLKGYRSLRRSDHATEREIQRATTAVEISQAKVQIVRDELSIKHAEFERTKSQLEKRKIRAPLNGIVVEINKEVGEFVSPTDPVIVTLVDLSNLKAIFSIPQSSARKLVAGHLVELTVDDDSQPQGLIAQGLIVQGLIEFVAPRVDPQSGTVTVKIRIENQQGKIVAGSACKWDGQSQAPQPSIGWSKLRSRR